VPEVHPRSGDRRRRAAVVLAAGADAESRALLTQPLGDTTVVQTALANVRTVVDPSRIVVVVARGDRTVRDLLGPDLTYVEQPEPRGTGAAALLGMGYLLSDVAQVLVAYADTPLLRPESLLGLFTRHRL
jgi:bifunctional N-acetylglucosamine-1-phosphate-uridyltransferase/glucosamine-1-phosphate-acetyltransferase GlmU-like protein